MSDSALLRALRDVWVPLVLVLALVVVVGLTSALGTPQLRLALTEMLVRMSVVVGIYIFAGNSGVISFGHIGFMCVGAYAAGWAACDPQWKQLMLTGLPDFLRERHYPMPVAVLGSGMLGAAVAVVFGIPIMRLSGIAASIATFCFLVIVNSVYSNWDSVTAGTSSLVGVPTVVGPWWALLFAAIAILIAYRFQTAGIGLMLRASREDEVAAAASAVDIRRARLAAFIVSGFVVAAAGGVYAHFVGVLTTDTFYLDLTFITIAMLIVGGTGSLSGAVVGVVLITFITEVFRRGEAGVELGSIAFSLPRGIQEIGLGALMVAVLVSRPSGIMGGREVPFPFGRLKRRAPADASPSAGMT